MNGTAKYQLKNQELFAVYVRDRSIANRNSIFNANTNLLHWFVNKYFYLPGFLEMKSDLFQEASLGLIRAIEKYDVEIENACFASFARPYICGDISHYLRDKHWIVRKPRDLHELIPKIDRLVNKSLCMGRSLTRTEICTQLEITAKQLDAALLAKSSSTPVSLNERHSETGGELIDFIPDGEGVISGELSEEYVSLRAEIARLPDNKYKTAIQTVFFIEPTIGQAARRLGSCHVTIARHHAKGVKILRKELSPAFS
jgi:RNA polymerase sigma-B factor